LLIRVPHQPLALTATGALVIGELRRIVDAADEFVANARGDADHAAGVLRFGCFSTLAPIYVPSLIARASDVHPAIDIEVAELSLEVLQTRLLDGRLELGLLYDLGIRSEIATQVLAITQPHVLVWEGHRLGRRRSVRLAELADDPMIMLDVPPSRPYFESVLRRAGIDPPIARTTESFETLRSLVARRQGWAMLIQRPRIGVSYEGLALHTVPIGDALEPMPFVAAWPDGIRLTRRATVVRDLIADLVGLPFATAETG
jgi:DNA-binding transcriptional LysR family regulator